MSKVFSVDPDTAGAAAAGPVVVGFADAECDVRALVGGKAANLGRLTKAGLPVPPGFAITTAAFATFLDQGGIRAAISRDAGSLRYDDAALLEEQTQRIRELILATPIPGAVERSILEAYRGLGAGVYVAVRSSATAEDMEEASFAGLHDTYLDIRGEDEVLAAVRRCWASLWTARCASYRDHAKIDHSEALIAVAVQVMVPSETAGVLFTANPLNAVTNEFVANASYGLGEGVVSGILTPDEFIVDRRRLAVKARTLGGKEREVVRHDSGVGTKVVEVEPERRERFSLEDGQVSELAAVAARVMEYYDGFPQDIEWAFAGGRFFVLQARAVTGVEFLWEEDVESWQIESDPPDTIWSHTWAEAYWTGGVTPLFYSVRGRELRNSDLTLFSLWGFKDLTELRRFKYRRATVYFSSTADRIYYRYILPPALRVSSLQNLPPGWREEAGKAPFDYWKALRMHLRVRFRGGRTQGPFRFMTAVYDLLAHGAAEADGPSPAELRQLGDGDLKKAAAKAMQLAEDFLTILRPGFHVYSAAGFGALTRMLRDWYRGANAFALQDLISGLPQRTAMVEENIDVWEAAQQIRRSPVLSALILEREDAEFFDACEESEDGRRFLAIYREFLHRHGHRGHADRDIWFPRRSEDPSLDYRALRTLVSAGDTPSPETMERRLIATREATTADVLGHIRRRTFGRLKARLFTAVLAYVHRFLVLRDDERHYIDRVTMAKKRAFQEVGRRLVERGKLARDDDFYFLSEQELWALIDGAEPTELTRAKIANRRRVFESYNARRESPPTYLRGSTPVDLDGSSAVDDASGVLRGMGTSRGSVTGRARVVPDLKEIGRLEKGDILICNATDPGWASVFALISGLVMETGGLLAHGSCLSREYGLPAVTLAGAIQRIPDGATITVVGDTGEVRIEGAGGGGEQPGAIAEQAGQAAR